jgi:pteridine reductase
MDNFKKVALVTGAGKRRIGSFVAEALAEKGYAVAIHYRESAGAANERVSAIKFRGGEAMAVQADLTDEKSVQELVRHVVGAWGQIDVLVNAAGLWVSKKLEDVTSTDVRKHFEVNTLGTFLCSKEVGLLMTRQKEGGCIVTFGDWAESRPYLDYAAYFPSKGTIPALTRSLAVELGTRSPRVRVNCILPGPVMMPDSLSKAERDEAIQGTLVKREGSPVHIVQTVLFLINNDFMTGSTLTVDGGRTIFSAKIEK